MGAPPSAMSSDKTAYRAGMDSRRWSWGLDNWGNRLLYCAIIGLIVSIATGVFVLGVVVTAVLFLLTSAIVAVRR